MEAIFKKFLAEYLENVGRILPQSYRAKQLAAGGIERALVLDFEDQFLRKPFENAIKSLLKELNY